MLKVLRVGNVLKVSLSENLSDNAWSGGFGSYEKLLLESDAEEIFLTIEDCKWGDPHPILSLLLYLRLWIDYYQKGLTISLPSISKLKSNYFIPFLAREGFLEAIALDDTLEKLKAKIIIDGKESDVKSFFNYVEACLPGQVGIMYKNQTCIKSKIIDLQALDIDMLTESLLLEAKRNGVEKFLAQREDFPYNINPNQILQEVRQVISELLQNIKEHAYEDARFGEHKYAGIYVRIRNGYAERSLSDLSQALRLQFRKEEDRCPALKGSNVAKQCGFIEVFVSDIGLGLQNTLREKNISKNRKTFLRSYFEKILKFMRGEKVSLNYFSKYTDRERIAKYKPSTPGIVHLAKLLGLRSGFIRFFCEREWYGITINKDNYISSPGISVAVPYGDISEYCNCGTHITIRVPTGKSVELPEGWITPIYKKENVKHDSIYRTYSSFDAKKIGLKNAIFLCEDDQAAELLHSHVVDGLNCNTEAKLHRIAVGDDVGGGTFIIWRPSKTLSRWAILLKIRELGEKYKVNTLIIVDQDVSNGLMAQSAILKTSIAKESFIKKIVIITNNFSYYVLERTARSIRFDRSCMHKFNDVDSEFCLGHVLYVLRLMDTWCFWKSIYDSGDRNRILVDGPIKWKSASGKEIDISLFFNFNNSLDIKACIWCYKRSLLRVMSYLSPSKRIVLVDHHLAGLLNGFFYYSNAGFLNNVPMNDLQAIIGSVAVSGETSKTIEEEISIDGSDEGQVIIHFLHHFQYDPTKTLKNNSLWLLTWPKSIGTALQDKLSPMNGHEIGEAATLERVVDYPVVAKHGNKYWKLVRAINNNSVNIYGCSPANPLGSKPSEAYAYWQRYNILKFGHWENGNYHDCVGLNIIEALRMDSMSLRGPIWAFLESHFRRLMGKQNDFTLNGFKECQLLVYVSNAGTQYVIETLTNKWPSIKDKIVKLSLVQKRRKATRLRISPLDFDLLLEKISKIKESEGVKNIRILLFDISFSSIRTFFELRSMLISISPKEIDVDTIALLDRTRLPNDENLIQDKCWHKSNARLWRLDHGFLSPSSEGSLIASGCPFCEALNVLEAKLSESLTAVTVSKLRRWKDLGRPRVLLGSGINSGILPVNYSKPKSFRFCISREEGKFTEYDKVEVVQSTALSALLLEVSTMTGDYSVIGKKLGELAEFIKVDEDNGTALYDAKIEIVATQLAYLRNDMTYGRRLILLKLLLDILAECPASSRATIYASLLILSSESSFAKLLLEFCYNKGYFKVSHLENSNEDFIYVLSHIVNSAGEKFIVSNKALSGGLDLFMSIGCFMKPSNRNFIGSVLELFTIIGYRKGAHHKTQLFSMLVKLSSGEGISNLYMVQMYLERIAKCLSNIETNSFHLSEKVKLEDVKSFSSLLRDASEKLNSFAPNCGADSRRLRSLSDSARNIFDLIYGSISTVDRQSLHDSLKAWFTVDKYNVVNWVDCIVNQIRGSRLECGCKIDEMSCNIEEEFEPQKEEAFPIITRHTELLIRELLLNAYRYYSKNSYDDEININASLDVHPVSGTDTILIDISNRKAKHHARKHSPVVHQAFFEEWGGKVETETSSNVYSVKVYLPVLNSIIAGGLS